ncbi:polysaccharide deacetylase family protein [Croceibacter atlanticus]|uniref:polysaccharide deacetylase family protein n=1 Tax=Croceibacter atlanticus TaxID=313588 RepID=UPI0030D8F378|tara:strand:- start:83028 stop:83981 length:954 start_codon:yes stop_codon:yes gene_type:complete
MIMENGNFIISLDFELHWGNIENCNIKELAPYFIATRDSIPLVLDLFERYNIKATWATVGFLFAKNKEQLLQYSPNEKPNYKREELSYYDYISKIGNDENDDPFHFANSIIKKIIMIPGQELASHTFCHYYCLEEGQNVHQFESDLIAAKKISKDNFGVSLKSLVFPRNQFNKQYLEVAFRQGINVVRSNPDVWFWKRKNGKTTSLLRAIDTLMPISKSLSFSNFDSISGVKLLPASRFFRPYSMKEKSIQSLKIKRIKKEMTYAAKHKSNYHLWWHPHNFGNDVNSNIKQLTEIINHFYFLKEKYGFQSKNMIDFS